MAIELTRDEQLMEIEDAIEESVEYYVMCDECNGVTNFTDRPAASDLYEQGWRMVDNDNRVLLTCPKCVNAPAPTGITTAPKIGQAS